MYQPVSLKWDIWWMVFALLEKQGEYDTIATCTAVCQTWRFIGWSRLPRSAVFSSDEEVAHIKVAYEHRECWRGPLDVRVRGQYGKGRPGSIAHLGTLAARFGGTWTHTVVLTITAADWHRHDVDSDTFFHNLSRFHSISFLTLSYVRFSSILSFCRLVCSLPGLKKLSLTNIALSGQGACDYRTISDFRRLPTTNVEELVLNGYGMTQPFPLLEILDFFAVVALSHRMSDAAKGIAPAALFWGKIQSLDIKNMAIFPSVAAFGRILSIFPALQRLQYCQGTSFPFNHILEPRSVPRNPFPRMASLRLVPGNPPSVIDGLLDFFITTAAVFQLSELHGNLSPHLLIQTDGDHVLHKLTKYVGASLHTLRLHSALPSQLLVTSARISKVEINFKIDWVTYDAAIQRLCEGEDGLTRIDAILSTPVFGALAEVVISYSYDMQRAKIGIPAMQTPAMQTPAMQTPAMQTPAMHSYPTP
ncbi:predicted protein [Postia placenta Mad-698-R]|nr:predicted protein [Postia placenta Mad-698-R]